MSTTLQIPQTLQVSEQVKERANYTCEICTKPESLESVLHIHHIRPVSDGGTKDLNNLMALCSDCNCNIHSVIY
jgi:5-methylcytosine-specific restriction endonuclease McrA